MRCPTCRTNCVIYKQINRSGATVVVERCPKCRTAPDKNNSFLPKKNYDLDKLPVFVDYTPEAKKCEVVGCTNVGSEWHHYAPQHLFQDANDWPTGYLCKYHHDLWHKITKTGSYK